jgi:hypothetical protein
MTNEKQSGESTERYSSSDDGYYYIDLCKDCFVCELCYRYIDQDQFYKHLSEHTIKEVELLKKITEKSLNMTTEQYETFVRRFYVEKYWLTKLSLAKKSLAKTRQ